MTLGKLKNATPLQDRDPVVLSAAEVARELQDVEVLDNHLRAAKKVNDRRRERLTKLKSQD